MSVLSARYRLGERIWTFDSRHKKAIESLAEKGYAIPMHGIVEKTVRASLTEAGKAEYILDSYVPQVFEEYERKIRKAKKKGK